MGVNRLIADEIRRQVANKQENLDEVKGRIEDLRNLDRDEMGTEELLDHQDLFTELELEAEKLEGELESMGDEADMYDTYDTLGPEI